MKQVNASIFIGLGANLHSDFGWPHQTLAAARREMAAAGIEIKAVSSTWLTAPVPVSDQPWYHNEVVVVETVLSPELLLDFLQMIENDFGRVRTVRNAPRIIDLDLIAYHDVVIHQAKLTVPHPRMHQRAFVLKPLQEIAPDWVHPVLCKPISELVAELPADQQARPMGTMAGQVGAA